MERPDDGCGATPVTATHRQSVAFCFNLPGCRPGAFIVHASKLLARIAYPIQFASRSNRAKPVTNLRPRERPELFNLAGYLLGHIARLSLQTC